ncbi:MAG: hypothetical protein FWH33_01995 [Oscillospiraceae bacterium]|nr:hypothetical protein [Oscillospiraceae bacterium]
MQKWTLQKRWIFIVSVVFHAMLLMVAFIFQGMIFPYIKIFGLVPLLLPIVSTGAAVYQGRIAGGVVGLFAGVFCDVTFNAPPGVFTMLLTITGILVGFIADTVMARGFVTYMISCTAVLAVCAFAQMFPLLFLQNVPSVPLLIVALRQTAYSLIYALPIWFFVRALGKRAQRVSPSGRPL